MLNSRFYNICRLSKCKMSIFTKSTNPITGMTAWEEKDPDYDYYQEIARSAFADMLHDHERNLKYFWGIRAAIDTKHKAGEKANVLDIGTGTGLLSMMAARCGADSIIACEAFKPMAECAKEIIKENGFQDKIKLIYKRSTQLTVGHDGDLLSRANILVTEVFDTELIGEGALSTFKHAQEHLLEKDPIVIPSSGTVYAQVVESNLIKGWNRINPIKDPSSHKNLIVPPPIMKSCSGASSVHDIQLSQLPEGSFTALSEPQPIYRFDWTGKTNLKFNESNTLSLKPISKGIAHAVFMWWDLNMDMNGKILLSCAPVWAHPDVQDDIQNGESYKKLADKIPWRDHWMQAIYYLPNDCDILMEDTIFLNAFHDEYSFWFSVDKTHRSENKIEQRPVCDCFMHLAFSRTRIGQLNDEKRNEKYLQAIKKKITADSVCLCLTDSSLLGIAIAKMNVKRLFLLETNALSRKTIEMFIKHNNLENITIIDSVHKLPSNEEINLIFGEPYFVTSILPWDNFYFWYLISKYPSKIARIPQKACIKGVAVEFKDLHKIRAPLGICESFDLTIFDHLVQSSSNKADSPIEAQPLWEYPGKALTKPFSICQFDFENDVENENISLTEKVIFHSSGFCNGIAIWIDWYLDDDIIISSGPTENIVPGMRLSWDPYTRQGVHLPYDIKEVSHDDVLTSSFKFNAEEGTMKFCFEVTHK